MTETADTGSTADMVKTLKKTGASRKLAYVLAAAAVLSGIATVAAMIAPGKLDIDLKNVAFMLYVDGILLLLLGIVIGRRLLQLWSERRRGAAGAGLHRRLVILFSLVAMTPAVLVAVFSALFLKIGVDAYFAERVNSAIQRSLVVSKAYLQEHMNTIQTDAYAIANELNVNAASLAGKPGSISRVLSSNAVLRTLSEAIVVDAEGRVLGRSRYSLSDTIDQIPRRAFVDANDGAIAVLGSPDSERIRALIKLTGFFDTFLLVEKFVDARVVEHIKEVEGSVSAYKKLEKERSGFQVSFVMIFVVVTLLLLLAAAWIGLTVANRLASPISRLISATDHIGTGDLSVRVEVDDAPGEISSLGHAFNNMTSQLESQREGLITANRELDERRRFTETVLTGVSAGVIGLDADGRINLPNRSASELLAQNLEESIGKPLGAVVEEMAELVDSVREQGGRQQTADVKLVRNKELRTFHVRAASERLKGETIGYVVTFDDVTELLSAQRKAAWADVARRIAHEIKNPLTPIQLSAERLKRKYSNEIQSDPSTFVTCTETIVRQVEDIGRMVDEFSAFARMPEPSMKQENLSEICRQAIFLEQSRHADIRFDRQLPETDVSIRCDSRQVSRALANLLKNAAESVSLAIETGERPETDGFVGLRIERKPILVEGRQAYLTSISIEDNGVGLPPEHRDQLTEPYVTTREKGTGLGLAIVKKIMEDHNGELHLDDRDDGGAIIRLVFPGSEEDSERANEKTESGPEPLAQEIEIAMRGTRS